ncbi:hypothetical protein ACFPJ1_16990 [Kribbella qitaiheensis]|uniref:hypothetical protein n=1 Tax=Kribbella qitaiheensis TaxID=1544730 RepID=UPI0036220A49
MASWTDHPVRGVIAGLLNRDGELVMIGRTVPLTSTQSAELAAALPGRAGPPRPDEISPQRWGGRDSLKPLTKVTPTVVPELSAVLSTSTASPRSRTRPTPWNNSP